ncbi:MAG: hypothetical protein ACXWZP_07070 [Gaiellaceae bacterium]
MHGAELERRPFTAPTADWDHEHCILCQATFLEPPYEGLHEGLVHGYDRSREMAPVEERTTALESGGRMVESPIEEHWICETCFADFAERFSWSAVDP